MAANFEPRIVGFLCHWCAYSAADLAGASHLACPPHLRAVRVMCSARVDPTFVLQAFADGADGVLVCGCHPGDCHYISGNLQALGRLTLLQNVLRGVGVEPQRLRLAWASASQAERFVGIVVDMVKQLRTLGPARRLETGRGGE